MKKILLCFDNSTTSFTASAAVLRLAHAFGSAVTGIHAYNASMHEGAFRIMEPTLPQQYQNGETLQKQRKLHNKLINVGMEKISLSYLKPLEESFYAASIPFCAKVREGKNYQVINEIISEEEDGDLIVIGSTGFNINGSGFVGSVCLRVLRSNDRDCLIIRKHIAFQKPKFVIGLDGSASAVYALTRAKMLAEKYGAELHLVYVFDSTLHKGIFMTLKESLIQKEGFNFNSKEQEKIHDQFIDKGLMRVGKLILDRAEKDILADSASLRVIKKSFEGHLHKKLCDYAAEIQADMIFVGRTGRHHINGMDIGSVTENTVRFSPCSVYVSKHEEHKGWVL
ncbi:MAG TPA: universal stress protein [Thermodesulfovibrionia bacterium]|nr:universal stress protein [Thermodesulfovibrionia bacterium]